MWRNSNSPYAVGIMDLPFRQRQIRKMWLMKAAQVAGSEALRNIFGCVAHQEPDPALLQLPDENAAKKIMRKRIIPLFEDTPVLASLKTSSARDTTVMGIVLKNGFELAIAWAGSPTTAASDPIRFVGNDEVDKYPSWSGKESDPVSLAEVRTVTYADSLVFNLSTPTTRDGPIFRGWEACPIKLWFFVPCPHCGTCQRLTFDRLTWGHKDEPNSKKRAALIAQSGSAWYRCINKECTHAILDHHKPRMCNAGYWGTDDGGYKLFVDGREEGKLPPGNEVGMHISALYSLAASHNFPRIASEWCQCEGDPMKTQNFRNSWLGEVYEEVRAKTQPSTIRAKSLLAGPPLVVPSWAGAIFATADTQKDHFHFVIRAWGYNYRSHLLLDGMVKTFDELYAVSFDSLFQSATGEGHRVHHLLIDSGGGKGEMSHSRTSEVYQFAARDPGRIHACKGASHKMIKPYYLSKSGGVGMSLFVLDTHYYKDMLTRLLQGEIVENVNGQNSLINQWLPHSNVSDDYCQQMASEHKVRDRKKGMDVWLTVTNGAANHKWDCEVLQCAAAEISQVAVLSPEVFRPKPPAPPPPPPQRNERADWMPDRPSASDWMPQ